MDADEVVDLLKNNTVRISLQRADGGTRTLVCTLIESLFEVAPPEQLQQEYKQVIASDNLVKPSNVFIYAWETVNKEWVRFNPNNIKNTEIV